ncbi:hypothetical protein BJV74DRAFT_792927 [Russula compacta]|nr:hypothetical protein BJV74DRAFT_792927 [Russula compacta]
MSLTSRSLATLAFASSSRLAALKISRSTLTTQSKSLGGKLQPAGSRRKATSPPPSLAATDLQSSAITSSQTQTGERPLLQPYELSGRLIALCKRGDVDLAFTMLQNAPRNAQNIKVWNTLILQCMDAEKYKLAYRVFTDMKRRGFVPNIRTYTTMMSGYASVEDWELCPKQLGLVHSIYGQLTQHLKNSPNLVDDPVGESGASSILYPIALYISILGKAGKNQKAFDVFHKLDTDGPLAPHPKVYSSLLCVLADRVDMADAEAEAVAQSVSDAKYVWRRLMRSLDRQPQHYIEPRSVEAMINVLSRGEPSDHELMFDILRDICGLPRPNEARPPLPPKVKPTTWILTEVLKSCVTAGHPAMAVHYAQSVIDARELRPLLRPWHLYRMLHAQILLAKEGLNSPARSENAVVWVEWMVAQGNESVPKTPVLLSALRLCYLCQDAPSALRIARVMLEGPLHGLMPPTAWTYLFRLANVTSPDTKRQCLELLNTHRSVLDIWSSSSAIEQLEPREKKAHASLAFCIIQALRTDPPSPGHDGAERPDAAELEQYMAWSDLRRRAELFSKRTLIDKRANRDRK